MGFEKLRQSGTITFFHWSFRQVHSDRVGKIPRLSDGSFDEHSCLSPNLPGEIVENARTEVLHRRTDVLCNRCQSVIQFGVEFFTRLVENGVDSLHTIDEDTLRRHLAVKYQPEVQDAHQEHHERLNAD